MKPETSKYLAQPRRGSANSNPVDPNQEIAEKLF